MVEGTGIANTDTGHIKEYEKKLVIMIMSLVQIKNRSFMQKQKNHTKGLSNSKLFSVFSPRASECAVFTTLPKVSPDNFHMLEHKPVNPYGMNKYHDGFCDVILH